MTKAALKTFSLEITRKQKQLLKMREDLDDMMDHLVVLKARAKAVGGKRHSTEDVKKALGL